MEVKEYLTNPKVIWKLIYFRAHFQDRVVNYNMTYKKQESINVIRMTEDIFMMSQIKNQTFSKLKANSITKCYALTAYRA